MYFPRWTNEIKEGSKHLMDFFQIEDWFMENIFDYVLAIDATAKDI